ncbi:MAG: N-acetylmuramoyl-L-alanine amidase [Gammaproteobacteria bacterium]|nr:N-acetylmuramoyl-L-alanine amidase [Gammaproteobacteria bacterium]
MGFIRIVYRLMMVGVVGLFWAAQTIATVNIQGVRLWAAPDNTRVVLDLDRSAKHDLLILESPNRVVIDIAGGALNKDLIDLPAAQGFVTNIRTGRRKDGSLRVVLDVSEKVRPKSFLLKPNAQYGYRLVIDLAATKTSKPVRESKISNSPGRDVVVAIDAGHGGEDPGAVGRKGTREKDVVLQIARRLAKKVDQQPGMRAYLVRDGDYFLPHAQRMKKARLQRADLFVSIHADSFTNRKARGASVYVLSEKGASDEATRRLAERENSSDLIGGVSLADKDDVLASVLLDLSQSYAISASMNVADSVLEQLGTVGSVHKSKVLQANFLVLKSPDIPSILVETAFISNPQEEKKLRDSAHQERMAGAMLHGLVAYLYANPPAGTLLARGDLPQPKMETAHVIRRGDTLSGIASHYSVSVRKLREYNRLRGDRIMVGQVIQIPVRY